MPRSAAGQAEENLVEEQPALHVRRKQEVLLHVFATVLTKSLRQFAVREQIADLIRATLDGVNQSARDLVNDLVRNTSNSAGDLPAFLSKEPPSPSSQNPRAWISAPKSFEAL